MRNRTKGNGGCGLIDRLERVPIWLIRAPPLSLPLSLRVPHRPGGRPCWMKEFFLFVLIGGNFLASFLLAERSNLDVVTRLLRSARNDRPGQNQLNLIENALGHPAARR